MPSVLVIPRPNAQSPSSKSKVHARLHLEHPQSLTCPPRAPPFLSYPLRPTNSNLILSLQLPLPARLRSEYSRTRSLFFLSFGFWMMIKKNAGQTTDTQTNEQTSKDGKDEKHKRQKKETRRVVSCVGASILLSRECRMRKSAMGKRAFVFENPGQNDERNRICRRYLDLLNSKSIH